MGELENQIKVVAQARKLAKEAVEAKISAYSEWEMANRNLIDNVTQTSEFASAAETVLRDLTIQVYQATGNKAPAFGVGIRELTKLEYDPKEALKWAMSHQIALSLDKKSFEGFAKATPLEFVKVNVEAQATIATDLSKVLE